MVRFLLPMVLIGCAAEEPAGLVGQAAPPGNTPALAASEMTPGSPMRVSWGGLPPGAAVTFAASSRGPGAGPCPPVLGGACMQIRAPIVIGTATANADGLAVLVRALPAGLPAGTYAFQAVATWAGGAALSEVFQRATGPGFCGLIWDPVCGFDGRDYDNECMANTMGMGVAYWGNCIP